MYFSAQCENGWTRESINGKKKCFKNIGQFQLVQSVSKCKELGAELPLPLNKQDDTDLYKVIQSFGLKQAALDGNDVAQEGVWRRDNGDLLTYFNWAQSVSGNSMQPNNWAGREDFLYYYKDGSGKWGDYSPTNVVSVVCEKEIG